MTFLKNEWKRIQPKLPPGDVFPQARAQGYIRPWNHDRANMEMICNAIVLLRPLTIIELGTFEGLGTEMMAKAVSKYVDPIRDKAPKRVAIWTFDAGKPILENWDESLRDEISKQWPEVEAARAERINRRYDSVEITYIEGLTRHTLPRCLSIIRVWDFCFQDSVHDFESILTEWRILKEHSHTGSVIVFDDITHTHPFRDYFFNKETSWNMRHTEIGRGQLWAERIY